MFILEQKIFIVQCYFRNGERLENGEWSYSRPRVFEEFLIKAQMRKHVFGNRQCSAQKGQWTTDKKNS
jgi:hypothetical protein